MEFEEAILPVLARAEYFVADINNRLDQLDAFVAEIRTMYVLNLIYSGIFDSTLGYPESSSVRWMS